MTVWSVQARVEAAAQGRAMPDGSFPVDDVDSLVAAVRSVPRVDSHRQLDAASHLLRRANELGVSERLLVAAGLDPGLVIRARNRTAVGTLIEVGDHHVRVSGLTASGVRVHLPDGMLEITESDIVEAV
jgi:hypothetical protein